MIVEDSGIRTGYFREYDADTAAQIGRLMPQLKPGRGAMDEAYFNKRFADNPERGIVIATHCGRVISTLTLNIIAEQSPEAEKALIGGVVVDEDFRGTDAAAKLWAAGKQWCRDNGIGQMFLNTEKTPQRERAITFYRKMGAKPVEGAETRLTAIVDHDMPLPDDALIALGLHDDNMHIRQLEGGIVNKTFQIESDRHIGIVQQLNPNFDPNLLLDSDVIATHLVEYGWEAPIAIRTKRGGLAYADGNGDIWRQLPYIESDGKIPDNINPFEIGSLLGRWHQTVATLDYEPAHAIPHFHDTDWHAEQLRTLIHNLPDQTCQDAARRIIGAYERLEPLPDTSSQLLHGDPKLANFLYRDGKPFTLIDFDTIMRGPIWLDIGDLLRSKAATDIKSGQAIDTPSLAHISEGYRQTSMPEISKENFHRNALLAAQTIALELAMRYMNDIVDDNYFAWNHHKFHTRRDSHLAQAEIQWQIYDTLKDPES